MSDKSLRIELTAKDQRIAELQKKVDYHNDDMCDLHESLTKVGIDPTHKTPSACVEILKEKIESLRDPNLTKTYPNGTSETHPTSRLIKLQDFEIKALQQKLSVADKALEIIKGGMSEKGPRVIAEQALKTIRGAT